LSGFLSRQWGTPHLSTSEYANKFFDKSLLKLQLIGKIIPKIDFH
jgi:hypothetical protein